MSLDDFYGTSFAGDIPWMASVPPMKAVAFSIKLQTLEPIVSEVPFGPTEKVNEATVEMRDIQFMDEEDAEKYRSPEDGEYKVPFWACGELQKVLKSIGKAKGWIDLVFKRESEFRENKAGDETEYNSAIFAIG